MGDFIVEETIGGLTIRRRVIPSGLRGPYIDFCVAAAKFDDEFARKVQGPMLKAAAERIEKLWGNVRS